MRYYLPPTKNKVKRLYRPFQHFGIFHANRRFKQQHILNVFHTFMFWILLSLFGRIGLAAFGSLSHASTPCGLAVELPGSKHNDIFTLKKNSEKIFLYVDRNNNFVCDDKAMHIKELSAYLADNFDNIPNGMIILKCDQKAEMGYILQIMEQVRKSKFDYIIHSTIQLEK